MTHVPVSDDAKSAKKRCYKPEIKQHDRHSACEYE